MFFAAVGVPAAAQAPAPVLVLPLPGEGLTEEIANATLEAVTAGLRPTVERRELQVVTDGAAVAAAMQCAEPSCFGQQIASLGGSAAVLVRISRPDARGPLQLRFEVLDAVTGAARGAPVDLEIPPDAVEAGIATALAPAVASLGPQMPPPPARAMFLVAVNNDGATVRVNGEPVGETPIAPLELAPGSYTIQVTQRGYETFNRSVDISASGGRLNVDLEPAAATAEMLAQEDAADAENFVAGETASKPIYKEWWLWAAVGGAVLLITTIAIAVAVGGGGGGGGGFQVPSIPGGM